MNNKKQLSLGVLLYIFVLGGISILLIILSGYYLFFSFAFIKYNSENKMDGNNVVINDKIIDNKITTTKSIEKTTSTTKKITTTKMAQEVTTKPKLIFSDNSNSITNDFIINDYEKDIDNIQEVVSKGMDTIIFNNILNRKPNYISSFDNYEVINYNFEKNLTYDEIEKILYKLNNSNIVQLENIGKSVDNRNIYALEVGKGDKTLIIDANIHASEAGTTSIILKFLIDIINKYEEEDNNIIHLLNKVKVVVIPCINPDGYEVYNFGINKINNKNLWIYRNKDSIDFTSFKFNANGVDINRNLPSQNGGLYYKNKQLLRSVSKSLTTKKGVYFSGKKLGSEPETQALMYILLKHYKNAISYINMHSQGRVIYYGKPNLNFNFNNASKSLAEIISSYTSYIPLGINYEEVGQGNDGTATDFMAELINGFKFSNKTGRLTNNEFYLNSNVNMKYNCAVVTLELLKTITKDVTYYKNEYYDKNFYNMFKYLLNSYI